jgi:hypothetical protein
VKQSYPQKNEKVVDNLNLKKVTHKNPAEKSLPFMPKIYTEKRSKKIEAALLPAP